MKLSEIMECVNQGKTIIISNYLHAWRIDKKVVEKWKKCGLEVLKENSKGELFMGHGRRYDCITGCNISVWEGGAK